MKSKLLVVTFSVAMIAVGLATPSFAQTVFGTILGTVTDSSGAVVSNAVITVTNQGENISREIRSDAQGNYQAENLKAGLYTVSATGTGFRDSLLTDVRLDARQTVPKCWGCRPTTVGLEAQAHIACWLFYPASRATKVATSPSREQGRIKPSIRWMVFRRPISAIPVHK